MQSKVNFNLNFKKDISSILFFILFWIGLLIFTGNIPSHYHFIDDHQIITLNKQLNNSGVISVAIKSVKDDHLFRLRPLFSVHYVFLTKLFGMNITAWSVYFAILGVLTSFFLFKFLSILNFTFIQSILFSLLTLTGVQSVIWYQFADAENLGMFFLSLSLLFLAKSIYSGKYILFYKIFFILSLLLSALCKESFILMIPAVLFLYLWQYSKKKSLTILKSVKDNLAVTVIPLLAVISLLFIIVFFIGIDKTGQTGVDNKIMSLKFLREFFYTLRYSTYFLIILFGIFILIDFKISGSEKILSKDFFLKIVNEFLSITILFFLIIIPQFTLYYKSGMRDRYFLPFIIGFSFFIIFLIKKIYDSNSISVFVKYLFLSLTIIILLFEIRNNTIPYMRKYADDSISSDKMLNSIILNTKKESVITAVMDPVQNFEQAKSLMIYLKNIAGIKNINFNFTKRDYITDSFSDSSFYNLSEVYTKKYFVNSLFDSVKNKNNIECVVLFPKLENNFLKQNTNWFNKNDFRREEFDFYTIYYKNN